MAHPQLSDFVRAMTEIPLPRSAMVFYGANGLEVEVHVTGEQKVRYAAYDGDQLKTYDKVLGFMSDPKFQNAYARGMNSGHQVMRPAGSDKDLHVEFRVHILISAATMASRLEGDFVECGVNTGCYSLAICEYLDINNLDKNFFLFDTFKGVPEELAAPNELERVRQHSQWYPDCYEIAKENFKPYPKAKLIRGNVPDTLPSAGIDKVCYLSIDMNIVYPERAAIEYFWDKLAVGAPVILDDYAWLGYELQKKSMDDFAASKGTAIMTLPTGQGLLIKT